MRRRLHLPRHIPRLRAPPRRFRYEEIGCSRAPIHAMSYTTPSLFVTPAMLGADGTTGHTRKQVDVPRGLNSLTAVSDAMQARAERSMGRRHSVHPRRLLRLCLPGLVRLGRRQSASDRSVVPWPFRVAEAAWPSRKAHDGPPSALCRADAHQAGVGQATLHCRLPHRTGGKMNRVWHEAHPMPRSATPEQRISWHMDHARNCGCRPIPAGVLALIKERKVTAALSPGDAKDRGS